MAQLHCYVPEEIARQAQRRATQFGLSLSRYLAELVKRDTGISAAWPEGYFDIFGKMEGAPLERPPHCPWKSGWKSNELLARHQRLHTPAQ